MMFSGLTSKQNMMMRFQGHKTLKFSLSIGTAFLLWEQLYSTVVLVP